MNKSHWITKWLVKSKDTWSLVMSALALCKSNPVSPKPLLFPQSPANSFLSDTYADLLQTLNFHLWWRLVLSTCFVIQSCLLPPFKTTSALLKLYFTTFANQLTNKPITTHKSSCYGSRGSAVVYIVWLQLSSFHLKSSRRVTRNTANSCPVIPQHHKHTALYSQSSTEEFHIFHDKTFRVSGVGGEVWLRADVVRIERY